MEVWNSQPCFANLKGDPREDNIVGLKPAMRHREEGLTVSYNRRVRLILAPIRVISEMWNTKASQASLNYPPSLGPVPKVLEYGFSRKVYSHYESRSLLVSEEN